MALVVTEVQNNMNKLKVIVVVLFSINSLLSCSPYKWLNKSQIINAAKDNNEDLYLLTKEMYDKYNDPNKKLYTLYIENKFFKNKYSYSYRSALSKRLFEIMKIDYVAVYYNNNYKKNSVEYFVRNVIGDRSGFYYSFDNNKNYYCFDDEIMERLKDEGLYLEFGNKTVLFDSNHGWYTEKICDNWYYFEEDFDYLNFIKYVYDDIINMNPPNKYYQKNKQFFEKFNPHKSTNSTVDNNSIPVE